MARARRYKRAKRWLVYAVARLTAAFLLVMPLSWALAFGRLVGRIAGAVDRSARGRAVANLCASLGLDRTDAERLAGEVFANAGMVAVEIALLPRLRRRFAAYVELPDEDLSVLKEAYDVGRGVLFVTGHVGNWELLAQRVLYEGFDAATVARDAPNPYLGRWLVARRAEGKLETINRGDPGAARKILGALKRGALLGLLIDQDTRVQSVHVPFFGRPAATPVAAAELALRRGAPVVAGFIHRRPGGGHRVRLERISLDDLKSAPKEDRVREATARFTRAIEDAIRESPAEWVWFHARWKTPPPGGTP